MMSKRLHLLIIGLIVVLGFSLYSHVLLGEFCYDDQMTITENPAVRDIKNFSLLWQSFNTRIITGLTFALNYYFSGFDVYGFHLVNILIHCVNAVLLYGLIRWTFLTPALRQRWADTDIILVSLFTSLIFVSHPIQTQAVSSLTQRAMVLAIMFYLLALNFYALGRLKGRKGFFIISFFATALGMMSKETAITIPVMLAAYEFFFFDAETKEGRQRWKRLLPFILLMAVPLWILSQDHFGSVLRLKDQLSSGSLQWQFFLNEANVLRTYLRFLIFPVNQIHEHVFPLPANPFNISTVLSLLLIISLIAFAIFRFKDQRLMSFCIAWSFIATAVESKVMCLINKPVFFEHWLYLAVGGFAFFIAVLLRHIIKNEYVYVLILICYVSVLVCVTYQRNKVWINEIALWTDAIKKNPNNPDFYFGLGAIYHREGNVRRALEFYNFVRKKAPDYPVVYSNLAAIYSDKGNYDQALEYYYKVLGSESAPPCKTAVYHYNIGLIYDIKKNYEKALRHYHRANALCPFLTTALGNLAIDYLKLKQFDKGIQYAQEVLAIEANDPQAYEALGLGYFFSGRLVEGKENIKKAIELYQGLNIKTKSQELREILEKMDSKKGHP